MTADKSSTAKIREANAKAKKLEHQLRALVDAALLHLKALDAEMAQPPGPQRGARIAKLAGGLEYAIDYVRYFSLGVNYRDDPKAKARETQVAEAVREVIDDLADGNPPPEEQWCREDDFDPRHKRESLRRAELAGCIEVDRTDSNIWCFRLTSDGRKRCAPPKAE